jgi:4,5-DOPA dioxygenase extradiol
MNSRTLFISHGAPDELLVDSSARAAWDRLGARLQQAKPWHGPIAVASAHYLTRGAWAVGAHAEPDTIHDFHGFADSLHQFRYPANGDRRVAQAIVECLDGAGLAARLEAGRSLDHGIWAPLSRLWPMADVTLIPLSVRSDAGPEAHYRMGQALAQTGIPIIGSGALTHNLREVSLDWHGGHAPDWVRSFADWFHGQLIGGDVEALLDYRRRAPHAERNHPTDEHLMPLFVALGAAGPTALARAWHRGYARRTLAMDSYLFESSEGDDFEFGQSSDLSGASRAGNGTTTDSASAGT